MVVQVAGAELIEQGLADLTAGLVTIACSLRQWSQCAETVT